VELLRNAMTSQPRAHGSGPAILNQTGNTYMFRGEEKRILVFTNVTSKNGVRITAVQPFTSGMEETARLFQLGQLIKPRVEGGRAPTRTSEV
jgi:hypothetical protein